ncbi:MAG: DNA mismatch repair protein, partial [Myxococcales bacterium]|nr:DNA mismatch repair protein [Myxococcales bacterium]
KRIDTLAMVRDVVELCATGFEGATSGLGSIRDFAAEVRASDGWARLVELLDYENDMAKVDVRMQVGADGRVRSFTIVELQENEDNRFYASPLSRLLTRFTMFWRGYRLEGGEMVSRWLDLVFQGVSHYLPPLMQLLGHMEIYLAMLAFRDDCTQKGLEVCFAELSEDGPRRMQGLFNPLLFDQGVIPIPCDLDLVDEGSLTVITGPNSGGKTRLLQSLGLSQLLAQSGFYVPAARAEMPLASGMFVSLIDEARADQKEGRLGTELLRIRRLFETARGGALVLLDELCSGTNPSEGEEIFYLVLTLLGELGPEAFITTHFLEFARRLAEEDRPHGVRFLQVELDEDQHPTYGFTRGVATTSLAAQTAARLGVTREELLALVRRNRR